MGMTIVIILLLAYGAFCVAVGLFKIPAIWDMGKIQGFRKYLGDVGTQIFLIVWGLASLALGIFFLVR